MYHHIKFMIFAYRYFLQFLVAVKQMSIEFFLKFKRFKFGSCSVKEKMKKSDSHDKVM